MAKKNNSMDNWNVRLLEQERQRLHKTLDAQYDRLIRKVLTAGHSEQIPEDECLWSLACTPGRFKGTKITGIWFPNGKVIPMTTWKGAAAEILRKCNEDTTMHSRLLELRNIPAGRFRCLLGSDASSMNIPLKIDEDLYLEGKQDTEYLLKTVTKEIMDRIGFDYSRIGIQIKNPELEIDGEQTRTSIMHELSL